MTKPYADHLEQKINTIYRTYYSNFGSVPVPESAELKYLWQEWEWENAARVEASDGN